MVVLGLNFFGVQVLVVYVSLRGVPWGAELACVWGRARVGAAGSNGIVLFNDHQYGIILLCFRFTGLRMMIISDSVLMHGC